jgi:hypothetical protein
MGPIIISDSKSEGPRLELTPSTGLTLVSEIYFPIMLTCNGSLYILQNVAIYMHVIFAKQILCTQPTHQRTLL